MNANIQAQLDSIKKLVDEGKTDKQISEITHIKVYKVGYLRRQVLKISLYEKRIKCANCGKEKSVVCFSSKSEKPDWCIICRNKNGIEKSTRGRPKIVDENQKKQNKKVKVICNQCKSPFYSEVFLFGGLKEHYRMCKQCREFITYVDRVSI